MARIHDRVVADAMFAEDAQDPWEQEASGDVQEGPQLHPMQMPCHLET